MIITPDVIVRFNKCIEKQTDGCWHFRGQESNKVPQFFANGISQNAQRVSWLIHRETDLHTENTVYNKCKTRGCLNPDHLSLNPNSTIIDTPRKPPVRLTLSDQKEIREFFKSGATIAELMDTYNVSRSIVWDLVKELKEPKQVVVVGNSIDDLKEKLRDLIKSREIAQPAAVAETVEKVTNTYSSESHHLESPPISNRRKEALEEHYEKLGKPIAIHRKEVIAAFESGMPLIDISKKYDCPRSSIANVIFGQPDKRFYDENDYALPRNGIKIPPNGLFEMRKMQKINQIDYTKIKDDYKAGSPIRKLSVKYGISEPSISRILNGSEIAHIGTRKSTKYTQDQIDTIAKLHFDGVSADKIAFALKMPRSTVRHFLSKYKYENNIPVHVRPDQLNKTPQERKWRAVITPALEDKMCELYNTGIGYKKIAEMIKLKESTAYYSLQRLIIAGRIKKRPDVRRNKIKIVESPAQLKIIEKVATSESPAKSIPAGPAIKIPAKPKGRPKKKKSSIIGRLWDWITS